MRSGGGNNSLVHSSLIQRIEQPVPVKMVEYDNQVDPYQMSPIQDDTLYREFDNRLRRWIDPQDPFPMWVGWQISETKEQRIHHD